MFQVILLLLPVIITILASLLQLRLSALGLSPVAFDMPDLPTLGPDDRFAKNIHIEKIGENDLLYPEAIAISDNGDTAFISLGDGRVVRLVKGSSWDGVPQWETLVRTGGRKEGGTISHERYCGTGGPADLVNLEPRCGRPLGLWMVDRASVDPDFDNPQPLSARTKEEEALLVADAYMGLLLVTDIHSNNAEITTLAMRADSDPVDYKFSLLNGIVQTSNGDVYFTETSQKFHRRRIFHAAMDGTPTGRLLRYRKVDDEGGQKIITVDVMAENIYMPNGMAVSHDEKSLVIVAGVRILRFDIESEQLDSTPFVNVMPGTGDNIKAMRELPNGKKMNCYWTALGGKYTKPFSLLHFLSDKPWIRSIVLALVPYSKIIDLIPKWTALAVYDEHGNLIETLRDDGNSIDENGKKVGVIAPWLSEVEPLGDSLYLLSWYNPFLGRIKRSSINH